MNAKSSFIVPSILFAILVHAIAAGVLMANWNMHAPIEIAKVEPYYINAELVARNPYTLARQQAEEAAQQKAQRVAAQQRQQKIDQEKREQLRQQELAKQRARAEDQARLVQHPETGQKQDDAAAAQQAKAAEAERIKMEASLSLDVMDEQDARQAVTDDERAMAYVSQIKRVIIQNWSRPPSARNGMQALLKVHLVPTGEVVDVTVVKSSGNDAFDRSAVLAVQKSERFDVPSDSREFERNFREFEVLFRPEDLRL